MHSEMINKIVTEIGSISSTHIRKKEIPLDLWKSYVGVVTHDQIERNVGNVSICDLIRHVSIGFWEVCDEFSGCVSILEYSNEEIVGRRFCHRVSQSVNDWLCIKPV
jgi:hypothetical protein